MSSFDGTRCDKIRSLLNVYGFKSRPVNFCVKRGDRILRTPTDEGFSLKCESPLYENLQSARQANPR